MKYDKLYEVVIEMLNTSLSNKIVYHKSWHTIEVISNVAYLGEASGIDVHEMTLLKTAALLHDIGYIVKADGHEEISCDYAKDLLPQYDYNEDEINAICTMIRATKVPQKPINFLSEILCDADLFYLGKTDYEAKAQLLHEELKNLNNLTETSNWLEVQNTFFKQHKYFTEEAKKELDKQKQANQKMLETKLHQKINYTKILTDIALTLLGITLAAFALNKFLVPNHFFDGGVTGLSLLVHEIYHINLALIIFLFNLPLIIIGYYTVGKKFAIGSFIAIGLLGIALLIISGNPLTSDKLLIALFGGVFLGTGIGLVMRTGAALDGIEVLALYTLKRTSFTISEIILGLNVLIFTIAGFYFGIESALYSILTYFVASRSIDYVVEGLQSYTGVTIISGQSENVKSKLVNSLGRGITIYKGQRGFLPGKFEMSEDCDIIFTVITRLELRKLTNIVHDIDPKAFIFANTIKEASGGILKRIHHH